MVDNLAGLDTKESIDSAGLQHTNSLAIIISQFVDHHSWDRERCFMLLIKMQRNNFVIYDDLIESKGAGVFPVGALLNHSCKPNCILTYQFKENLGFQQIVRAIKDIEPGEEITHAYVDQAQITPLRREKLFNQYHFYCLCEKCVDAIQSGNHLSKLDESMLGYRVTSTLCAIDHEDENLKEADSLFEKQFECESEEEREQILQQVLKIRQDRLHEYSLPMLMTWSRMLDCQLAQQKTASAIVSCRKICEIYERSGIYDNLVEGNVVHPLLGLQLFTLGDLLSNQVDTIEQSKFIYKKALFILEITHGKSHEYAMTLKDKINTTIE